MRVWRKCCADPTSQKGFVRLPAGDFSLDNAPWLGRPVEVDSNQINKVLVKMKNVSFILQKKVNGHFGQPNRW